MLSISFLKGIQLLEKQFTFFWTEIFLLVYLNPIIEIKGKSFPHENNIRTDHSSDSLRILNWKSTNGTTNHNRATDHREEKYLKPEQPSCSRIETFCVLKIVGLKLVKGMCFFNIWKNF